MARMFENEQYYYCRACGKAPEKDKWKRMRMDLGIRIWLCPHCGGLFALDVSNVIPPDEPVRDEPEPELTEPELTDEEKAAAAVVKAEAAKKKKDAAAKKKPAAK